MGNCCFKKNNREIRPDNFPEIQSLYYINWKRGKLIGQGAYGKVYECLNTDTGQLYVVKHVKLSGNQRTIAEEVDALQQEISLLKQFSHKNIVKYINAQVNPSKSGVNIILEHVPGGSVRQLLDKFQSFDEKMVRRYTQQLLQGLAYLHSNNIVHRDIKSSNLLVDSDGTIKLTDFGASKRMTSALLQEDFTSSQSLQGSPYWMAPEMIKRTGHSFPADIWSVGCVVIEMVTGQPPWSHISRNAKDVLELIYNAESAPPVSRSSSKECLAFISNCCQVDPLKRPSAMGLMDHCFIQDKKLPDGVDLSNLNYIDENIKNCTKKLPPIIGMKDMSEIKWFKQIRSQNIKRKKISQPKFPKSEPNVFMEYDEVKFNKVGGWEALPNWNKLI